VAAEADADCDRNEGHVLARGEDIVKAAFDEKTGAPSLEIEACASIDTKLRGRSGGREIAGYGLTAGVLEIVNSAAANEVWPDGAGLGGLELIHQIAGPDKEASMTAEAVERELLVLPIHLNADWPSRRHDGKRGQPVPSQLGDVIESAERT
jgi:hypothetical protein